MNGDYINAFFEFGASVCLWRNVAKLRRDKEVRGVCPSTTIFFTAWGYWNVWFYPSNGFTWSCVGGVLVVAANTAWLALVAKYSLLWQPVVNAELGRTLGYRRHRITGEVQVLVDEGDVDERWLTVHRDHWKGFSSIK